MKKFVSFSLILISFTISVRSQTQIPNGNFETWQNSYKATGWTSYDFIVYHTCTRTSDAFEGSFAAKLATQNIVGTMTPGVVTLGTIDFTTYRPKGGIPYSDRPTGLSFEMKYNPVQGDTMVFFAYLTKWNSVANKSDTVGGTLYYSDYTTSMYQKISLPFVYKLSDNPDTINIGFLSSAYSPKSGSTLTIDDLQILNSEIISTTICLPPTNIVSDGFTAHWLAIPNATSYLIDIATDYNFQNILPQYNQFDVGAKDSLTVISLPTGLYYYRVSVLYSGTQSIVSNREPASLPTIALNATLATSTGFTANWTTVTSATGYQIDVATDSAFTQILPNYSSKEIGEVNNLTITGLSGNTNYFYRLRTKYGTLISCNSNVISVTTSTVGISNIESEKPYQIIVNLNAISIKFCNQNEKYKIELFDLAGKKIFEKQEVSNFQTIPIKEKGIFVLKLTSNKIIFTEKISW